MLVKFGSRHVKSKSIERTRLLSSEVPGEASWELLLKLAGGYHWRVRASSWETLARNPPERGGGGYEGLQIRGPEKVMAGTPTREIDKIPSCPVNPNTD